MLKEVVIALLSVTTIVGIIAFLIRQGIWTRYIQPLVSRKPKYSLLFDNGQDVIRIPQHQPRDLNQAVSESMQNELKEHPYMGYTEPSYQNPFPQLFEGPSSNKKIYNDLLKDYLEEKETEYRNRHNGEIENEYMVPVHLTLHNKGEVASGKVNLLVDVEPHGQMYLDEAKEMKMGDTIEPPMYTPEGCFPLLAYNRMPYQFIKWNFSKPLTEALHLNIDFLNHHSKNDTFIPVFYVDSRTECRITIKAKIIDSSVLEPFEIEPVIIVEKDKELSRDTI